MRWVRGMGEGDEVGEVAEVGEVCEVGEGVRWVRG